VARENLPEKRHEEDATDVTVMNESGGSVLLVEATAALFARISGRRFFRGFSRATRRRCTTPLTNPICQLHEQDAASAMLLEGIPSGRGDALR